METGSFVFNVVTLERAEHKDLWRSWKWIARDEEDDATILVYIASFMEKFACF
jgi:hypothetical protein